MKCSLSKTNVFFDNPLFFLFFLFFPRLGDGGYLLLQEDNVHLYFRTRTRREDMEKDAHKSHEKCSFRMDCATDLLHRSHGKSTFQQTNTRVMKIIHISLFFFLAVPAVVSTF